jgi:hypothetical protein
MAQDFSPTSWPVFRLQLQLFVDWKRWMVLNGTAIATSTEKAKRYLAERRFIHALIPDTDIVLRYTNSRK